MRGVGITSGGCAKRMPLALCDVKKMMLEVNVREDKGEDGIKLEPDRLALVVMVEKFRTNDNDDDERQCECCENHQRNYSDEEKRVMVGAIGKVVKE